MGENRGYCAAVDGRARAGVCMPTAEAEAEAFLWGVTIELAAEVEGWA